MMEKIVGIVVTKEDYFKAKDIVNMYAKGTIHILSNDTHREIMFPCSIFKVDEFKRVMKVSKTLGLEAEIEIA